ncbi:YtxH domain-containing protein [Polaribacter sp. P097]|uniref:YtxH domain-containing protein n=1 Tax=Polaribacter sp. P097 TaxID=3117398 RepID=UPI002FE110D6
MSNLSNFVLGAAVGSILGILYAPDKGEETRKKLMAEALVAKDKLAETAEEVKSQVSSTVSNQKQNLETQLESVMSNVSYKAEDVITTLERKLSELKEKNKHLQKNTVEDLEDKFNQTV